MASTPTINFPAENSQQRAGSSNSLRPKVPLKRGKSLMDWIRLGNSGMDLSGVRGTVRPISTEELAKHNKEDDVWTSIRGKVYNITPYLEYHPGGVPEIMKGAGIDATELFDKIHKWVNAESMLEKCFVGPLIRNARIDRKPRTGSSLSVRSTNSLSVNSLTVGGAQIDGFKAPSTPTNPGLPRHEWYQNEKMLIISIYTKKKDIKQEDIILEIKQQKEFRAVVTLADKSYEIHLELEDAVNNQQVRIQGETGKVEVLLTKVNQGKQWSDLGRALDGHKSLKPCKSRDSRFWDCRLQSVKDVTHNVKLFCFELPDGVLMKTPLGHHLHVKRNIEGMEVTRSYTVALPSLQVDPSEREFDGRRFYFMIKIYPTGAVTPTLQQLVPGQMCCLLKPTLLPV